MSLNDALQWLFIGLLLIWCATLSAHALAHSDLTKLVISKLPWRKP